MSWFDVVKVRQDLTEPLQLDGLYELIKAIDSASTSLSALHQNNSERIKSQVSEKDYEKWFRTMQEDKSKFLPQLNQLKKNVYVMLRTLNGKTDRVLRGA